MVDVEIKHLVFVESKSERPSREKKQQTVPTQYDNSCDKIIKTIPLRNKHTRKSHFKIHSLNSKIRCYPKEYASFFPYIYIQRIRSYLVVLPEKYTV